MLTGRGGAGAGTLPSSPSQRNCHCNCKPGKQLRGRVKQDTDGAKWGRKEIHLAFHDLPSAHLPRRTLFFSTGRGGKGPTAQHGGRQAGRISVRQPHPSVGWLVGCPGSLSLELLGTTNASVVSLITKTHQKRTRIRVHNSRVPARLALLCAIALHHPAGRRR